ncbi:MAG: hypothetical protein LBP62_00755 [Clostridiales bacterium]|nr:hypothetical protein [Clostridiales bacterium]
MKIIDIITISVIICSVLTVRFLTDKKRREEKTKARCKNCPYGDSCRMR